MKKFNWEEIFPNPQGETPGELFKITDDETKRIIEGHKEVRLKIGLEASLMELLQEVIKVFKPTTDRQLAMLIFMISGSWFTRKAEEMKKDFEEQRDHILSELGEKITKELNSRGFGGSVQVKSLGSLSKENNPSGNTEAGDRIATNQDLVSLINSMETESGVKK